MIQNSISKITNSGRSLRRAHTTIRSCGPPPPQAAARRPLMRSIPTRASPQPSGGRHRPQGSCSPPPGERLPMPSISCSDMPAAERTGLRRRGAALRQGAAAGCRRLRRRICRKTPRRRPAATGCRSLCDRSRRKLHNDQRPRTAGPNGPSLPTAISTTTGSCGQQLAKNRSKRTRAAGLRRAKLRPARPFPGRNPKFKIKRVCPFFFGLQPAERACSATNCGPPPPEAAARQSLRD